MGLFEDEGVPITSDEVRAPMGVHKRIHIQKICDTPAVTQRWQEKKGQAPTSDDAERIYSKSLSATLDVLPNNSHLIRGAVETINLLRSKYNCKIGASGSSWRLCPRLLRHFRFGAKCTSFSSNDF